MAGGMCLAITVMALVESLVMKLFRVKSVMVAGVYLLKMLIRMTCIQNTGPYLNYPIM